MTAESGVKTKSHRSYFWYNKAAETFKKAAESGNTEAVFSLGCLVGFDSDPSNDEQRLALIRKAAEKGHPRAQWNLGYEAAAQKDYATAADWYRKAAEQGFCDAQRHLGELYLSGTGVPRDYQEAAKWHLRAAEQEGTLSNPARVVGGLSEQGTGVQKDLVEACKWFNVANMLEPGVATGDIDRLERKLTVEDIARAQQVSSEYIARRRRGERP